MSKSTIGIFGGSGFVGGVLANRLVRQGAALRIFTRRRDHARHLWPLPDTHVFEVNPRDQEAINSAVAGCDAVVNLIGILNERGDNGEGFREAHIATTARIAKACKQGGVPRMLQMSALKADSFAPSYYLRTKGEAEKLLAEEQNARFQTTIMRPSVIFGPRDSFINRFAKLVRLTPGVFPLARADARFQPVYVGDVADAFVRALGDPATRGARFDLGGPDVLTLGEIVRYVAGLIDRPVWILPLGATLASLQANVLEYVPGKPFSRDNLRSLQEDSVLDEENGLDKLGVAPTPMHVIVPQYLAGANVRGRYYAYRSEARRDA